jgi:hypothetical protein
MERLRTPFFIVALVAIGLVVSIEIGSTFLLGGSAGAQQLTDQATQLGVSAPAAGDTSSPPGLTIPYLALIDVIALFTVALMGAGLVIPERIEARAQGVVTLVASILLIVTAIVLLFAAIAKLILMVTLFFAFPFGTIAYLIVWGSFPRGHAVAVLSVLMFLKLVFAAMLVAAQQRFIQNKGLVALILTSLVANVVATFLYGLLPGILVSIVDAVGAIIFAIVAIIWAIVLLIGSIPGIVNAVRVTAQSATSMA